VVNPKKASTAKSVQLLMEVMTQKVWKQILRDLVPEQGRRRGVLTSTPMRMRKRLRTMGTRKKLSMLLTGMTTWNLQMSNR